MRSFSIADILKRALPFVAAVTIGVFITSLFVDLGRPRFARSWKAKTCHQAKMLRLENEELKNENLRLRNQLESMDLRISHPGNPDFDLEWQGTTIDGLPAPPPVVKRAQ